MTPSLPRELKLRTPGDSYEHSIARRYEARGAHSLPHSKQQHVVQAVPAESVLLPHDCLCMEVSTHTLTCRSLS